jgi:hypothetical protein
MTSMLRRRLSTLEGNVGPDLSGEEFAKLPQDQQVLRAIKRFGLLALLEKPMAQRSRSGGCSAALEA